LNIRSITSFVSLVDPAADSASKPSVPAAQGAAPDAQRAALDAQRAALDAPAALTRAAREEFTRAGYPVQTARVATQPLSAIAPLDLVQFARTVGEACSRVGIDYVSLGALPGDHPLASSIPAAIAATENVFASVHIASRNTVDLRAVAAAAGIVHSISASTANGFGNLRFAALANCPPHSPFFPAAYHAGDAPAFALAVEGAPLAVDAFSRAADIVEARGNLISAVQDAAGAIEPIARDLAARFQMRFAGIDFSLAPYPDPEGTRSIGAALQALTGASFGEHGTLFAAAFATDCIKRARFTRVGFSGLMLPVLEDAVLAARSQNYTLDSLLLYSTVCGTGLDTVPLPGDTSVSALAAILLDLATLAVKLDKPLTARLLPVPGLQAGDLTPFDFEYFANARVMAAGAGAIPHSHGDAVQFLPRD
jgi:uncharacterized protein (UPF0210 family)